MTEKNSSNSEAFALINKKANETQNPSCQSLVVRNRRDFLITGVAGAAGLALSPIQRALALPDSSLALEYGLFQQPRRGFWATFLGVLDLAASLFGFGGVIPAITGLLKCVANNKQKVANDAFTNALGAMRATGFPLNIINRPSSAFSEIGIRLVSSLIQSLPCAQQSGSPGVLNHSTAHHPLLQAGSDLRFLTPTLRNDNLNGVTLHFDYTGARNAGDFDPKAAISAPTTHAITVARSYFERFGYRGDNFKAILVPAKQKESERAFGHYHSDYSQNDVFTTSDGATFDVHYSNVTDNGNGGTGQGEITFHGLVDKSASNKRMGLKRIEYSFEYPSGEPPADGKRRVRLNYEKGFTEFRP